MISTPVDWIYFIFGLYSFVLILVGTPLNFLCFYIFKRLIPNRSNATIIVFSYLSLVELLIPFTWNFNYAIRELVWKRRRTVTIKNLEQHSLAVCKLISFGAYFFLQSAAWLKTFATFARCVSLQPQWSIRKYILKSSIIHRLCWSIILFLGLINSPILFINGKRVQTFDQFNRTQIQINCYQSRFFQFWEIVHLLFYNFLPFILMILCNISIIRCVDQSRNRMQHSKLPSTSIAKRMSTSGGILTRRSVSSSGSRLTKTLLTITIFFILFTSPAAIFYISLGKIIKRHRNLITMGLSNLATTNHVVSFVIYWMTSSDFQHAAMKCFCCRSCRTSSSLSLEERARETRIDVLAHLPGTITVTENHRESMERKLPSFQFED